MRELKFRAWNINKKVWRHDVFISTEGCVYQSEESDKLYPILEECIIMQYTGMKDKNGKEIYEGDIYNFSGYCLETIRSSHFFEDVSKLRQLMNHNWKVEVVGNIYEK